MASENKRRKVFKMLNGRCFYCGCQLDFNNFHMDHFKSKRLGGKSINNLVPSCPECNLCKGALDIDEFRTKIAFELWNTFQGRIIRKYYKIEPKSLLFYFEEVGYGDL